MRDVSRSVLMVALAALLALAGTAGVGHPAFAKQKGKTKSTPAAAAIGKPNLCGCYKDATGGCLCGKKKKCGCPGECEPKGCAEKDARDMEKQVKAETKRAQEVERKQRAAADKRETAGDSSSGAGAAKTHSGRAAKSP